MLKNFYSCYSTICWPISSLFCCQWTGSKHGDETIDGVLEGDDFYDVDSILNNEKTSSGKRKSFGSVAEDTLPQLVPHIYVDHEDDSRNAENFDVTGNLQVSCQYSIQKKLLIVILDEVNDVDTDANGVQLQVRIYQVGASPSKKHRTKAVPGPNAKFGQTFTFAMEPDEVSISKIRFRLYRYKSSLRPGSFYGECHLKTAKIDTRQGSSTSTHLLRFKVAAKPPPSTTTTMNGKSTQPVTIEVTSSPDVEDMLHRQSSVALPNHMNPAASPSRRNSTVDSSGRFTSLPTPNGQPEALVTLCYLDQAQKVVVTVEKASNLDETTDTFLKISVVSQFGEELAKHRSGTIKASSDPLYECTAVFQIPRHELETSSVLIQVFRNAGMLRRRTQVGFVCVGENASSPDAQTHWDQMIQGMGTSVEKWHYLQRPETTKS